jgi:hypothetical protein
MTIHRETERIRRRWQKVRLLLVTHGGDFKQAVMDACHGGLPHARAVAGMRSE